MTNSTPAPAVEYDEFGVRLPLVDPAGSVHLHVPATHAHLTIVRSTVAASVARGGVTVDDVDDLRLAAHEACNLLIDDAVENAFMTVSLLVKDDQVHLTCSTLTRREDPLPSDTLSWTVLSTLVSSISNRIDPQHPHRLLRINIQHSVQIPS